jgi:1,2-phenylacetyl-CoA epoxidase PaaB subunit
MPIYEVFIRLDGDSMFRHFWGVEAPNDNLALEAAKAMLRRDQYDALWLVPRECIRSWRPSVFHPLEQEFQAHRTPGYFSRDLAAKGFYIRPVRELLMGAEEGTSQ